MSTKANRLIKMAILFLFCLIPTLASAEVATMGEARVVAENWMRFIVERDGHWGGAKSPEIGKFTKFRRRDLLLGYYASVKPQGYIVISLLKDFPPIKAYSTTSNLDPEKEVGMCALLKDVSESRIKWVMDKFGGLDEVSLQGLSKLTPDANRQAWSHLLEGSSLLRPNLRSIYPESNGKVGPLLETSWHQCEPYNGLCPTGNTGCTNCCPGEPWVCDPCFPTAVGCVATATAQVMRYYRWPSSGTGDRTHGWDGDDSCPGGETGGWDLYADFSDSYDWLHMANRYVWDNKQKRWEDENGNPLTQTHLDAVAELCYEVGIAVDMDYGCCNSTAMMCSSVYADAKEALKNYFFYHREDDAAKCEERDSYSFDDWWGLIKGEIDLNRPMTYSIATPGLIPDFAHCIVVDGYDHTGGMYQVHANYGWDNAHNAWYTLDKFDCDPGPGFQNCDPDEEELIWRIYPRDGICGSYSGTLDATGPTGLPHYIYCDVTSSDLTVEAGARVQMLGSIKNAEYEYKGPKITCSAGSINIYGSTTNVTVIFSKGDPTRGLKVSGGEIKLHPNGSIRVR